MQQTQTLVSPFPLPFPPLSPPMAPLPLRISPPTTPLTPPPPTGALTPRIGNPFHPRRGAAIARSSPDPVGRRLPGGAVARNMAPPSLSRLLPGAAAGWRIPDATAIWLWVGGSLRRNNGATGRRRGGSPTQQRRYVSESADPSQRNDDAAG